MRRSHLLRLAFSLAALAALAGFARAGAIAYATRLADWNSMGVTLTNYGVLGNNFVSRSPSFEYPLGTGAEHFAHAGLWIGARVGPEGVPHVTTGYLDGTQGASTPPATEFTPGSDHFDLRSVIAFSPYYSPLAVSEMDYLASFDDLTPKTAVNNPETHAPLGVRVDQTVFTWAEDGYANLLFLRFRLHNVGADTLRDAWVGLYSELSSGDKDDYSCWPPSGACSAVGGWYLKKWLAYDADFRMVREHYCAASPAPAACNEAHVPYWAGVQLLTPPDAQSGQSVTLAAWNWAPGEPTRDQDAERYAILSAGTIQDVSPAAFPPGIADPVELLALGPFAEIIPGDSVTVDFALVGGGDADAIRENAYLAQYARDHGYPSTPVPTASSLISAQAYPDRVELHWQVLVSPGAIVRVQRGDASGAWSTLADVTPSASGEVVYVDRDVSPGQRLGYRLAVVDGVAGWFTPETWIDVPAALAFALRGVQPNPADSRDATVRFALDAAGEAWLESFDPLGRREARISLGDAGVGEHAVPLARLGRLAPGLHVLRLSQGARRAAARVLIVR